jgi:hypothetical protein
MREAAALVGFWPVTPIKRRVAWGLGIALALILIVLGTLALADIYQLEDMKRCAPTIWKQKWPMWLGCVLAAQQDLAAGLIGGAGALFAAWLAFDAVQEQLAEERNRQLRRQAEAKVVATLCITQSVHAAASALFAISHGQRAGGAVQQAKSDEAIAVATNYLRSTLDSFMLREVFRDLGLDDRLIYLTILETLNTFVSISSTPTQHLTRENRLKNQRAALMNLHTYLRGFDAELANVYARDSKTTPPTE